MKKAIIYLIFETIITIYFIIKITLPKLIWLKLI